MNSTRKLVDSDEEQRLLEMLIDKAKPPVPEGLATLGLHYLLYTPFRHPPLRSGSRFGRRTERGIFYGAREVETCLAEVAYYRLVFLEGTKAELPPLSTQHTAFQADVRTDNGIDLTRPPFDAHERAISSPTEYSSAQELGTRMRADGVEVALYVSARAKERGTNVVIFAPTSFASQRPYGLHEWQCTADPEKVEFKRRNLLEPVSWAFPRQDFIVDGRLPAPALE
ncbi:MAG: RES family NAD+ phosphorylase [Myxococcaceae bacterium]